MGIAYTSLFWSNIGNSTSFKDIFQIPPGNYLIFNKGNLEIMGQPNLVMDYYNQLHPDDKKKLNKPLRDMGL